MFNILRKQEVLKNNQKISLSLLSSLFLSGHLHNMSIWKSFIAHILFIHSPSGGWRLVSARTSKSRHDVCSTYYDSLLGYGFFFRRLDEVCEMLKELAIVP